jgi:alanine racemase
VCVFGTLAYDPRMSESRPADLTGGAVSWLEVDTAAIESNVRAFRDRLPASTDVAAVVKANAYGHGVDLVGPAALRAGAGWLAVNGLREALELREIVGPDERILILGYVPPAAVDAAVARDLRLTVYDAEVLAAASAAGERTGRPARVHLKAETGTHRQGLLPDELVALARRAAADSHVVVEGLGTHFADIEDTTDHSFAVQQIERFDEAARRLSRDCGLAPLRHTACSAAAILFADTHLDIARIGISLYGLWPSPATYVSARERDLGDFRLTPALTWKTLVAQLKEVPEGGFVGYGRTWRAPRPSRVAVLPIGYYEGYDRSLSGRAYVLVRGRRAPVVGRICMNMTMVDVTDVPEIAQGDTVVLLGRNGEEEVSAGRLGDWAGTIHYEIVSRIHPSLPRLPV